MTKKELREKFYEHFAPHDVKSEIVTKEIFTFFLPYLKVEESKPTKELPNLILFNPEVHKNSLDAVVHVANTVNALIRYLSTSQTKECRHGGTVFLGNDRWACPDCNKVFPQTEEDDGLETRGLTTNEEAKDIISQMKSNIQKADLISKSSLLKKIREEKNIYNISQQGYRAYEYVREDFIRLIENE